MTAGNPKPPSLRQLLLVLTLLFVLIGIPVGLIIWAAVQVIEVLR